MKKFVVAIVLLISLSLLGQNEQLAQNYFDKGDFEKALISFDELYKTQPANANYFQRRIDCYQQLSQFDTAEKGILERLEKFKTPNLWVELGYNFQLQKMEEKAKQNYDIAVAKVKERPVNAYMVAQSFEAKILLAYAIKTYQTASEIDPKMNFNYQMAILYGQLGNTDLMIEKFLTEAHSNPGMAQMIQNQLTVFMNDKNDEVFNNALKKALLLRAQQGQDIFWNKYLSWFFVQQKEYLKAFVQEKAIFKRNPESFSNIVNLSQLAFDEKETDTAKEILQFVLENTQDNDLKIKANSKLMRIKIDSAKEIDYPIIEVELTNLLTQYGISPYSIDLQMLHAHFVTFNLNKPDQGKTILKATLELPLNKYQEADVKMELADILLFEEKFNQASIYYAQIEDDLKNDEVGHEASLKGAKTSYFKTDFDWAQKQFKTLKSASTQLIANDALEYFMLIHDNTEADSTHVALKKFAHGDYLLYQNKNKEALAQFQIILKENKGDVIESITLYRTAKIYEKIGDFETALTQYQIIIDQHKDGIYIDEALYFSAEIQNKQYNNIEKAKALYEQIIFQHQDSIYFIDARKKYRQLRGDKEI